MRITRFHITNFRNYIDDSFQPDEGINVLVGPNGQGKSAILEAAYVLATSKSHRTSRDGDLIRIGSNWARVTAEVEREERGDVILEITLVRNEKKTVRINRVKHEKVGDIVGQMNAVIFSSSDLDMVKGEPSNRRRFLNLEVSQISPQYVYALGRYKRVLEQRNKVVKEARIGRTNGRSLEVWDEQLVRYGSILIEKRAVFVRRLSEIAERVYNQLAGGLENLEVFYEPSVRIDSPKSQEEISETFAKQLLDARKADIVRGTTTKGPHRDDISFKVNDMEVRYYGSQGQQRSVALAVKLAEIGLVEETVGEPPIALLDDVGAELDQQRRAQVFDFVYDRCQTLVTVTAVRELPQEILARSTLFTVASGTVQRA
ncbi:MAG: DNA replication/repair protein RecF [Armatimonadetes bacterium]|nr:DNA replication/repair protein RecF [Armatimonadota bacterium]